MPTRILALALSLTILAPLGANGATMTAPTDTDKKPNLLAGETSPYLLQHAYNPVEWRPWGEEAFAEARLRNVPIFLSIGYSTCYWCHVMERESFESDEIAALMNEYFVCIKVDREERPDVDDIYMSAVQLITGSGGWPMSVWLTPPGAEGEGDPGLKPFFAGTYFPPEPRHGMPSFPQLLDNVAEIWRDNPEQIVTQAGRVASSVRERLASDTEPVRVDTTQVQEALSRLVQQYDRENGGFGGAPKFPQPVYARFLFNIRDSITDPAIRGNVQRALTRTLDRMALGGIYDQVGGGFHRYSTDTLWLVPHFEKMLYDNAQLASLYAQSAVMTGDEFHARVCADILSYVSREMTDESGAFFSAQDAEVNEREGLNYLWTGEEIDAALEPDDAALAKRVFGVDKGTNFTDPHHPEDGPKNVLFLVARPGAIADEMGMGEPEFFERLASVRAELYDARSEREQPGLDDKVIMSWNGLMIRAFADASVALRDIEYLRVAHRASDAIYETMRRNDGTLARTARNGEVGAEGVLEDYAAYVAGLLAMHRASAAYGEGEPSHLLRARALTRTALDLFGDPETGALYDTAPGRSDLFVRTRSTYDGAMPCGASVMLHNLIDLYEITTDKSYLDRAVALLGSMSRAIAESPVATINSTRALQRLLRIDETIPDSFGEPLDAPRSAEDVESPVSVLTTTDRLAVPREGEAVLPVRLEIEPPYHINAHDPGVEGLTPLRMGVAGGSGIAVDVSYPAGEPYEGSAVPDEMGTLLVHSGAVEFDVRVRRMGGPIEGRPLLIVTYQVCSDSACYRPLTVELDVALDYE